MASRAYRDRRGREGATGLTGPIGPIGPTGRSGQSARAGDVRPDRGQPAPPAIPARKVRPAAEGPQGATGATGPRGAQGPTGPQGPAGPAGTSAANALAQALGLVAWTSDPALISTSITDSSGSIHGAAVWLNQGDTINWLAELVVTDGSGMTHGAFAIYDDDLDLVAQTTDSPSAFQTAPADSWVKLSLTDPYTAPKSDLYYVVDLLAGSTIPKNRNRRKQLVRSARSEPASHRQAARDRRRYWLLGVSIDSGEQGQRPDPLHPRRLNPARRGEELFSRSRARLLARTRR